MIEYHRSIRRKRRVLHPKERYQFRVIKEKVRPQKQEEQIRRRETKPLKLPNTRTVEEVTIRRLFPQTQHLLKIQSICLNEADELKI